MALRTNFVPCRVHCIILVPFTLWVTPYVANFVGKTLALPAYSVINTSKDQFVGLRPTISRIFGLIGEDDMGFTYR